MANSIVIGGGTPLTEEIADYVVANETSGNWRYKKYNSGDVVCWGSISFSSVAITSSVGGNIYMAGNLLVSYPFAITEAKPVVSVARQSSIWGVVQNQPNNNGFNVRLFSSSSKTEDVSVNVQVWGRWK